MRPKMRDWLHRCWLYWFHPTEWNRQRIAEQNARWRAWHDDIDRGE